MESIMTRTTVAAQPGRSLRFLPTATVSTGFVANRSSLGKFKK